MLRLNVSHARTYLECPTKAYYEHHLRRVPASKSVPLEVGTCWHLAMEHYLPKRDKKAGSDAVDAYLLENVVHIAPGDLLMSIWEKVRAGWKAIEPAYMHWNFPDDWELLGVEKEISYHLTPTHQLQGTLDGLVKWNNMFWHLQHKTLSPSTPLDVYFAYMQRDWHENAYEFMCREAGYTPYGGTILNVVRKLSAKSILENPRAAVSVQYLPRIRSLVDKAIYDLSYLATLIEKDYANPLAPDNILQNRSSCSGRFGNRLCPYLDVCNKIARIDDKALFVTAEDRYAPEAHT